MCIQNIYTCAHTHRSIMHKHTNCSLQSDRIQQHQTQESICACVYESTCVYMHMYPWVCARMYTYACVLSRWQGGSSGGMMGVKHLCGSKPRSGQLQWPMFKVNGGLRWLFVSGLLQSCWTPSANRHLPSSSSSHSLLLSPSTGTSPENACPLGSILCHV